MSRRKQEEEQFFKACQQGRIKTVQEILSKYSSKAEELVNSYSIDRKTSLYYAISVNSFPLVRLLIKHGSDVNRGSSVFYGRDCCSPSFESSEEPPVVTAARIGSTEILRCLLRNGGLVNQQSEVLSSHANFTTTTTNDNNNNNNSIVDITKSINKDKKRTRNNDENSRINNTDLYRTPSQQSVTDIGISPDTGISTGIRTNECFLRSNLVNRSRPSSQCSYFGMSALHSACESAQVDIVKLLISYGADVNAEEGKRQEKPLHIVARCQPSTCPQQCQILQLLCSLGAATNCLNRKKHSPLYVASLYGCSNKVECLLQHGANPNPYNFHPRKFSGLNCTDWGGYGSAIHIAAYKDYLQLAITLINSGADINWKNQNGMTPLRLNVAVRNKSNIAALLIFHGALLNGQSEFFRNISLFHYQGLMTANQPFPLSNSPHLSNRNSHSAQQNAEFNSSDLSLLSACILKPRLDCESLAILLVQAGYDLNQDPWLSLYNVEDVSYSDERTISPAEWRVTRLCRWLRTRQQTVRSLAEISRAAIRFYLVGSSNGASIVNNVNYLPLPIGLKNFVLLKNLSGHNIEPAIFECLNELQ